MGSASSALRHEAQQILREGQLAEWDRVNALERPWTPESDPIPDRWTVQHLQRRLIEAMRTLEKMPGIRGPKEPGGHWPKHTYDWGDRLGWEELPPWEKRARDARQNRVSDRPTARETHQMEMCISWLTDFRKADRDLGRLISEWAVFKARDRNITDLCAERGDRPASFYRLLRKASEILVGKLNAKPVPVF